LVVSFAQKEPERKEENEQDQTVVQAEKIKDDAYINQEKLVNSMFVRCLEVVVSSAN
jgi:hypothetical protein